MSAFGYCRVSTLEQAQSGISLDAQEQKIRQYCELHELELVEIIRDEGQSGKSPHRPGLQRLLAMLKRGDTLVVYKLERLTRRLKDMTEFIEDFNNRKIEFASVSEHIDTSSAVGRFSVNLLGSLAQLEREQIGERTSMALQHKAKNGERVGYHASYGYRLDADGNQFKDQDEQEAIALMHDWHAQGVGADTISRWLFEEGYKSRAGTPISPKTIRAVLRRTT